RCIEPRMGQDHARARRGAFGLGAGPAVARIDQPQFGQSAIQHRARRRADVLAELWFDQDHRGAAGYALAPGIGAGHGEKSRYAACAPSRNSFQVMESLSALYEASMMLGETPTVVQRSASPSALSIITRVTAPVPAAGVRMRTL